MTGQDDARDARDALAEVTAERDRLQRWKDEALPVIFGLQELGRALDIPLGRSITGPDALEAVERMKADHAAALAAAKAEGAREALLATADDANLRERVWPILSRLMEWPEPHASQTLRDAARRQLESATAQVCAVIRDRAAHRADRVERGEQP